MMETENMSTSVENIQISEIDPDIIKLIRPLDTNSTEYKILKAAIEKDGQRHPITLRKLTEDELQRAKTGAIYGIIDGHHRFHIAKELTEPTIIAEIDQSTVSPKMDIILAYRLNESTIKMSTLDKGKILYELLQLDSEDSTNDRKKLKELGKEVFGIGTAMSYRALQMYKKSIGEQTQQKPPKSVKDFDFKSFKQLFKDDSKVILKETKSNNVVDYTKQIEAIDRITKELLKLKKHILLQDGVKEEVSQRANLHSDKPPTDDIPDDVQNKID